MTHATTTGSPLPAVETRPTRRQAAVFFGKAWGLRAARFCREIGRGQPRRFGQSAIPGGMPILAESRGRLYASDRPEEFALQAGKAQNLRLAAARLHGLTVPAGEVFSFWAHVPRPTRRRGFAAGRELREGCVIPNVGGGLCQLSNALYDTALTAGFEIVERHAHSRRLPGSMAEAGRDATVFWNYVDLRFRPPEGCRIEAFLTRDELVVRLRTLKGPEASPRPSLISSGLAGNRPALAARVREGLGESSLPVESCETCGVFTCFRHPIQSRATRQGITAWLVDGWWPEFDRFLQETHADGDHLLLPLDGARFRLRSYRWNTAGFRRVGQAPRETLARAWTSRRLASQGAARQQALLRSDAALAARYARTIPPKATHLVVTQTLLPFLWRDGTLGGRSFDALMTRLPMSALQRTLDRAATRHPDSPTLADFRADPALAAAEDAALSEAVRWITPHSEIARLAGPRAHRLAWHLPTPGRIVPPTPPDDQKRTVFFPASTLGRKGAYELRAAARQLGLRVLLGGPVFEGADFWHGIETAPAVGPRGWDGVRAVVLPSWVEPQPRRLLAAAAAGVSVIASEACGLADIPGVKVVPTGDVASLVAALERIPFESAAGSSSLDQPEVPSTVEGPSARSTRSG